MPRVFACLVIADAILFGGAVVLGLLANPDSADRHIILAVLALLLSALIQVLSFMYLAVGGRVARQAAHQAGLDGDVVVRTNAKKRQMTPLLGLTIASLVGVVATGATSWRGTSSTWFHPIAVGALVLLHCWVWFREFDLIVRFSLDLDATLEQHAQRKNK